MHMMVEGEAIYVYQRAATRVEVAAWSIPKIPGVYPDRISGCTKWVSMGGNWVCMEEVGHDRKYADVAVG